MIQKLKVFFLMVVMLCIATVAPASDGSLSYDKLMPNDTLMPLFIAPAVEAPERLFGDIPRLPTLDENSGSYTYQATSNYLRQHGANDLFDLRHGLKDSRVPGGGLMCWSKQLPT